MWLATSSLLGAPIVHAAGHLGLPLFFTPLSLLVVLAANPVYGRIVHGRMHPIALWGGVGFMTLGNFFAVIVAPSSQWQAFVVRLASCARIAFRNLLEDLLERATEPRDDSAAIQRRFSLEDDLRLIVLMHGDGTGFRIHHPHETDAASEILVHLRSYLRAPISRRSDFDCKICRSRPEPVRHAGRRDAFSPDERNVRLADRVGPAGEMKATGGHHDSETQRFDVLIQ